MTEQERTRVTKNGIPIYIYRNKSLHGFFLSLFVRAGAMYESEREAGITHFLEHTVIRNCNHAAGGKLYETLDRCGIEFNASTYSEMVQFYVSGATAHFAEGARTAALLFRPIDLPASEVDIERKRIKAEIRESDDKSSLATFTNGILFDGGSLSRSILGSCTSVNRIGVGALEAYRKRVFTKENLFFYLTGDFSDSDVDYLADLVGDFQLGDGPARDNTAEVPAAYGNRCGVYIKNADFTAVRFSFDIDMTRFGAPELDLLYDMLLAGYNSRFFMEMSENRGLFYDVSGAIERYRNVGVFYFTYEVKEKDLYDALTLTVKILRDFAARLPDEKQMMKAAYVDNAYMLYDDARECNFTMAYDSHIAGAGYRSLDERIEAYRRVTPETLRELADELFRRKNLTFTMKGRKKKTDEARIAAILDALG